MYFSNPHVAGYQNKHDLGLHTFQFFLKDSAMNNLKKLAVACVFLSSPAWAGEVTGGGDSTPVRSGTASSICAFSGLNDDGAGPSTLVQSYGMIRASFGGQAPFNGLPGDSCVGN
jgi:hypothetical protein